MEEMIVLEHRPVVICQCRVECHAPFRTEDDEWSSIGCLKYRGHKGPHGLEDTEEKPSKVGARVILREHRDLDGEATSYYEGRCFRCGMTYRMESPRVLAEVEA